MPDHFKTASSCDGDAPWHYDGTQRDHAEAQGHYSGMPACFSLSKADAAEAGGWWIWALQAPAETNPLRDPTGEWAGIDNHGPIFYVAGTYGEPTTAERSFEVEAGKTLVIPMLNAFAVVDALTTVADVDASIADWKSTVLDLFLEVDGKALPDPFSYYVETDHISLGTMAQGSLIWELANEAGLGTLIPEGTEMYPAKAAGYYVELQLKPGWHTLHFGGSADTDGDGTADLTLDITDHIRVVEQDSRGHDGCGQGAGYAFA
jgi:hypothetical protein